MRDVQRWLAEQPIASCDSADMERLREAAAVLSRPKPRQEDVRLLQNKWQVASMKNKKPRPLPEVVHELQDVRLIVRTPAKQAVGQGKEDAGPKLEQPCVADLPKVDDTRDCDQNPRDSTKSSQPKVQPP